MARKKVLVTGGSGFLGKALVRKLLNANYSVYIFSRSVKQDLKDKGARFIFGDVRSKKSVSDAVKGKDVVYHLAALVDAGIPESIMQEVNVKGTKNVLDACLEHQTRKLVLLSTTSVLGKLEELPGTENSLYNPKTPYQKTKYKAELLALKYHKEHDLPVVIARPSMIYGPENEYWWKILKKAKKKVPIIGDGKNKWPLVYVDDVVNGIMLAEKSRKSNGQVYIITGKPYAYEDIYDAMCTELGVSMPMRHIPVWIAKTFAVLAEMKSAVTRKKTLFRREYIDRLTRNRFYSFAKAKEELGYEPKHDLYKGMKKTVNWYRKRGLV